MNCRYLNHLYYINNILITEPDFFEYRIDMLKFINKYEDALFCIIISDKKCERKRDLVNDILNKLVELKKST